MTALDCHETFPRTPRRDLKRHGKSRSDTQNEASTYRKSGLLGKALTSTPANLAQFCITAAMAERTKRGRDTSICRAPCRRKRRGCFPACEIIAPSPAAKRSVRTRPATAHAVFPRMRAYRWQSKPDALSVRPIVRVLLDIERTARFFAVFDYENYPLIVFLKDLDCVQHIASQIRAKVSSSTGSALASKLPITP